MRSSPIYPLTRRPSLATGKTGSVPGVERAVPAPPALISAHFTYLFSPSRRIPLRRDEPCRRRYHYRPTTVFVSSSNSRGPRLGRERHHRQGPVRFLALYLMGPPAYDASVAEIAQDRPFCLPPVASTASRSAHPVTASPLPHAYQCRPSSTSPRAPEGGGQS